MPELIPQRPIVTSETPRSNISPGQVAAPFAELANALDKVGGAAESGAETLATKAGEEAGRKSVRTADDGSLVVGDVSNPFIIGNAAQNYEKAAKLSQFARMQPVIETDMLGLRLAHPNDPEGFKAAADGYAKKTMEGIQDPHIRGAVSDTINTQAQHNLRSSLIETNAANTAESLQTFQAVIKRANDTTADLARQDGGTHTKEYERAAFDRAAAWRSLQNDPRFRFSKERVDLEIDEAVSNDKIQEVIGKAQRQFLEDKDMTRARKTLSEGMMDPKLTLTMAKREHGIAEGIHAINNSSALDNEAIRENRIDTQAWLTNTVHRPNQFDLSDANNRRQRAKDIGDTRSQHEIEERIRQKDFIASFSKAAPLDQARMFGEMQAGHVPFYRLKSSFDEMLSAAPPEVRAGVSISSGVRSTERQAQLYADAVKKYGSEEAARKWVAPPGHSQHEKGNAADLHFDTPAAREWVHANAGKFGLAFPLANEPWHVENVGARGGPTEGAPIDRSFSSPTGRLFEMMVKEGQEAASKNSQTLFERIKKTAETGGTPNSDMVQEFAEIATRAGRRDLLEQAGPWLGAVDAANSRAPGVTLDAALGTIEDAKRQATTVYALDQLDHTKAILKEQEQAYRANPLAAAAGKGWVPPVGVVPLDNPAGAGAEFSARQKSINQIRQHDPSVGPISAITGKEEGERFANVLTQGDPKLAGDMLAQMRLNLSPEVYRATMLSDPVKAGMLGMFSSNIPARLDAAGTALNELWGRNGVDFERTYGAAAADRVMLWKGLKSLDPELRAKMMSAADDPSLAEARKKEGEAADAEFTGWFGWTPQKAADAIGNFWRRNIPGIHASLPRDPINNDVIAGGAMLEDFKRAYRVMRTAGVDPANAVSLAGERVHSQWQPTEVMGGKLMKNAPDTFYPADPLTKDHKWMVDQLKAEISTAHGPEEAYVTGETGQSRIPGWTLRGIAADAQTQREAEQFTPNKPIGPDNRPPSYQVFITDANGQDQVFGGPGKRFAWDPAGMMVAARARTESTIASEDRWKAGREPPSPDRLKRTRDIVFGGSNAAR